MWGRGIGVSEKVGGGRDLGVEEGQGVAVLAEEANAGEMIEAGKTANPEKAVSDGGGDGVVAEGGEKVLGTFRGGEG